MNDALTDLWARLHVETGLSRVEFEELDTEDIWALDRALAEKEQRRARRDARMFAHLANVSGNFKKAVTEEDFLPAPEVDEAGKDKGEDALARYAAQVSSGRKRTRKKKPEGESPE